MGAKGGGDGIASRREERALRSVAGFRNFAHVWRSSVKNVPKDLKKRDDSHSIRAK